MLTGPGRLDLKTAAARKGVSVVTIRRRIHDGTLPAAKTGLIHTVAIADLDAAFAPVRVVPKRDAAAIDELKRAAERVAAEAPPLTSAQRACLAEMLGGVL